MASEKIIEIKQAQVSALAEELKSSVTIVLAEYLGLTVAQDTDLRNKLREAGVNYKVIKNNIGKRAVEEAGLEGLAEFFVGPTAIAYSEDVVAPAKILNEFSKTNDIFKVKAGASEGVVLDDAKLQALANVPAVEELHARLARGVAWPFTHLAMLVKALAEKVEEEGVETAAGVASGSTASVEDASETADNAEETNKTVEANSEVEAVEEAEE